MAEHRKFCLIAKAKHLLDTWRQEHIQKQLRAAVGNDAVFGKIPKGSGEVGVLQNNTVMSCKD